ncbi:rhomboid family intramembrane serine protease [Pseudohongiella sp.]|uniref:Peptidase S54 rhomboid domain-containing protein n=1 Tax=marine sediment metagenome TaxID=412755 RepID=A0A0F9WGS6_9ZZZZ|nr:rhomboid family intramembrane serine protease [Pseudohongiella sp.]HDZ09092.1 rhomboid family intramembrane serine protease [Pseudohongiella sp.]HEA63572.1 rhomboid family intramembrane serine protease [Pseudohongiella sp.]
MHRAVAVDAALDLRPFVRYLQSRSIPHHITEESGNLVVWARSEYEAGQIAHMFAQWQANALDVPAESDAASAVPLFSGKSFLQNLLRAIWLAPVSMVLIGVCLLVALVSNLGADPMAVRGLFFPDLRQTGVLESPLVFVRTMTPALLHFGAVHLIFNLLWLWYFGRMIEPVLGWWRTLGLILLTAFVGNMAQYLWSGNGMFGGMSGVVYGLIGFIWMWQTTQPQSALRLPTAMIMVFLVALVLMGVLAPGMIATAAHAGGLLGGMAAGAVLGKLLSSR